jgi:hypothetical protein
MEGKSFDESLVPRKLACQGSFLLRAGPICRVFGGLAAAGPGWAGSEVGSNQ